MRRSLPDVRPRSSPEQGWERCQAGFDGISLDTGENYSLKISRGVRGRSLDSSLLSVVGSKTPTLSSLDINWSSSSDGDISDIEPLPQESFSTRDGSKKQPQQSGTTPLARTRKNRPASLKKRYSRRSCSSYRTSAVLDSTRFENAEEIHQGWGKMSTVSSSPSKPRADKDVEVTPIAIVDYESPVEEPAKLPPASCWQLSPTHQPSPGAQSPSNSCLWSTGTELLKKLKRPERTPDKDGAADGSCGGGDSAKKKRRFISGGLAERLQRSIGREKSNIAFWSHHRRHQTTDTPTQPPTALDLHIISAAKVRGLFVTRCRLRPLTPDISDDHQELLVLFTQADSERLGICPQSNVRVHAPWQRLLLPNYSQPVILCTYLCHSLDGAVSSGCSNLEGKGNGRSFEMKPLRPTQLFCPLPISNLSRPQTASLQSVLPGGVAVLPNEHVSDSFLDSIADSSAYSTSGICVRAVVHRVYSRLCNPEATLTLPRIRQGTSQLSREPRPFVLLLQDNQGAFCEVHVTSTAESWQEDENRLRRTEGKTMVFCGLGVLRRVNRTRSPTLFTLIDSLWSSFEETLSQSEPESQDSKCQGLVSPQNVCYILGVQSTRNFIREDNLPIKMRVAYRKPAIHTLRDTQQMFPAVSCLRATVYGKVVYARPQTSHTDASQHCPHEAGSVGWHLFLTGPSLASHIVESGSKTGVVDDRSIRDARLVHVHVRPTCYTTQDCVKRCLLVAGSLVLLRDLCLNPCHLYADEYSSMHPVSKHTGDCKPSIDSCSFTPDVALINQLSQMQIPCLSHLHLNSDDCSLVTVSGMVTGVDETTAYSWPACDVCRSNKLVSTVSSGTKMYCGICQRSVPTPLTKMHLEVFLYCPSVVPPPKEVKIKLLQSSIERLLPTPSDQDEGYDLQCILGVTIGPISCFLRAATKQTGESVAFGLDEVALEAAM